MAYLDLIRFQVQHLANVVDSAYMIGGWLDSTFGKWDPRHPVNHRVTPGAKVKLHTLKILIII